MFASKTPRDLNYDPEPMIDPFSGMRFPVADELLGYEYHPRPEFDHVQHNELNPILRDLREFWPVIIDDWIAALDDPWFMDGVPKEFGVATEEHREHARRVLQLARNLELRS